MKTKIKQTIFGLLLVTTLYSCKKESTPAVPAEKKLAKIQDATNGLFYEFTYNNEGRLIENKTHSFSRKFDYSTSLIKTDIYSTSNALLYRVVPTATSNGKVTGISTTSYKADGSVNYVEPSTYQYNADGSMLSYGYGTYLYTKTHTNGNLTLVNATNNGAFHTKMEVEYYTDKPAKLNINWFENRYMSEFLCDKAQFGTWNKNLPKKITYSSTGYMDTIEFTYTFDSEGYITAFTTVYKELGQPPVTNSYTVSYK